MIKGSLNWTFLIIGTVIGAGYASGRELWQFFGPESGLAILLFTLCFSLSSYSILMISYKRRSRDYSSILELVVGSKLKKIYDAFILFYLLATTIVMIAGAGAVGEVFHLSHWWGVLVLSACILIVFYFNIRGFLAINQFIMPALIFGLLSILLFFSFDKNIELINWGEGQKNWFAGLPFTSLNVLPLVAVLGAVGSEIKTRGEIILSSIASGFILGGITYLYNSSLLHIEDYVNVYEIPLFYIISDYSPSLIVFVTIILFFAIFTTAASNIIGIASRLMKVFSLRFYTIVCLGLVLFIPLSKIGFSALISFLYPAYGILNLYVLSRLIGYPFLRRG